MRPKKQDNKGQLQISFNWIFVLIVGAIILLFFITSLTKETDSSKTQLAQKASARLDAVFAVIQQNPDSVQIHDAPNYELDFYCTEEGHYYALKDSSTKNYLENEHIFAPETIGKAKLVSWTKTFSAPFPVSSILYLSDEKNQYVFITADPKIEKLYEDFPDKFSKKNVTSSQDIIDEVFRKYIIITDALPVASNINNEVRKKTQAIIVVSSETASDVYGYGNLKYYEEGSSTSINKPYVGQELLFAGIVSGNSELYSCGLSKVLEKTKIVAQTNLLRTQALKDQYDLTYTGRCSTFYGLVTQGYIQNLTESASNFETSDTTKNYKKFYDSMTDLQRVNENILRSDCTLLY